MRTNSNITKRIKKCIIFGLLILNFIVSIGCSVIYQSRLESMTNNELRREYNKVYNDTRKFYSLAQKDVDEIVEINKKQSAEAKQHQKSFEESPILTTIGDAIFGGPPDREEDIQDYSQSSASFEKNAEIRERKLSKILNEMKRRGLIPSDSINQ